MHVHSAVTARGKYKQQQRQTNVHMKLKQVHNAIRDAGLLVLSYAL